MVIKWIPQGGEIIWLDFDPQSGHEQAGKRPAIVLSPKSYNSKTGLILACPITSQIKGYPFEVKLDTSLQIKGVILADQIKNVDWQTRHAEFICIAPTYIVKEVVEKIILLLC